MVSPNPNPSPDFQGYCRKCAYNLHGLCEPRCPECGQSFDPANPRSFRLRSPNKRLLFLLHQLKRVALLALIFILLFSAWWGWNFIQWRQEKSARAQLQVSDYTSTSLHPRLKARLGRAGFVFNRVDAINLRNRADISDFSPLSQFAHLNSLDLGRTSIQDLSPLQNLPRLEVLGLFATNVDDLSPIKNLHNLRELDLTRSNVKDLSPIADLTELRLLNVSGTSVENLSPIARLSHLQYLFLNQTPVHDLRPLAGLSELAQLDLYAAPVDTYPPMSCLPNLKKLSLNSTSFNDLVLLKELPSLHELDIRETPITDLSPLIQGVYLLRLNASWENFPPEQITAFEKASPQCKLPGTSSEDDDYPY